MPSGKRVTDCLGKNAATWDLRERPGEPQVQRIDDRLRRAAPRGQPHLRRLSADARFDRIELADPPKRLDSNRRTRRFGNLVESAARVCPACREHDVVATAQFLESNVAIDVEHALEALQMRGRPLGFAVGLEQVDGGWRIGPAPRAFSQ
jgi:hypothetical protein